jgi:tetratricopeptide (TPR) repeat protein
MNQITSDNVESSLKPQIDPSLAFYELGEDMRPSEQAYTKYEVGKSFYQLAKVYYDKSDLDEAEKYFEQALACSETPRDVFSILKIYGFLIRIASEKLEDHKAQKYIQKAEEAVEELTSVLGSLNSEYFYNLGIVKNYAGDFEAAKENFEIAHKRSKEENETDTLAKCLLALATNSYNRNMFEESLSYLSQLNQLLKIIKKDYLYGAMFLYSAKVYTALNQFDNALRHFKLANETLQSKKCWNLYGYVLLGKGIVFKKMGNFEKALTFFTLGQESIDKNVFMRLNNLIQCEIQDVNDSSVDLYLDRTNRKVKERSLGSIDFKHRFVLLEILFLLAKNPGTYFDKEYLAKSIWKDEYNPLIHDKLIYTSVSRLRKLIEPKLEKEEKRKYIIRGKDGYTFNPLAKIRFHMESKITNEKIIGNVELSSPV